MLSSAFVGLLSLQAIVGLPTIPRSNDVVRTKNGATFTKRARQAFAAPAELKTASKIASLKKNKGSVSRSSKALRAASGTAIENLTPADEGAGYDISVNLGSDAFDFIFDTGSSDLWVPSTTFQCLQPNEDGTALEDAPQSACDFGMLFSGTFAEGAIANENFNISYGDGEFVIGTVGYESVSVAGITVDKQEIALASETYFDGDGVTSGIIGFAYPDLTSAFQGTDPTADTQATAVHYNPFIFNAIDEGEIPAMFSLALERGANGGSGQVALGGLPNISFTQDFATTPLEIVDLSPAADGVNNFTYYTITPDGAMLDGETATTSFPAIVDSGTTLLYYDPDIAEAVAESFDPPAVYIEEEGVFETSCDATAPTFGITIGGTTFNINAADLLLQGELGEDPSTGLCVIGIQPADEPYILGDVFLKNVVAVYDIGASEMKFAAHENY